MTGECMAIDIAFTFLNFHIMVIVFLKGKQIIKGLRMSMYFKL